MSEKLPLNIKNIAAKRSDLFSLHHHQINIEAGWNQRTTFTDITELAEDIAANGLIQPLRVRNQEGKIFLIDGERRWRAIGHGIHQGIITSDFLIPITMDKSACTADRLFIQISANTGVPFTLVEKGRLYSRLVDTGINPSDIAKRAQSSRQAVYQALSIVTKGSPHLIALIESGHISATLACDIITSAKEHDEQDRIVDSALADALQHGSTKATSKNIHTAPTYIPEADDEDKEEAGYRSGEATDDSPNDQDEDEDEDEEDDDEPPTTIDVPKSTINPPPNKAAYDGLVNAPSTNRDGSSGGPTTFADPSKQVTKLNEWLEKFHYSGPPDNETTSTDRLQGIEIALSYMQGETNIKFIDDFLQVKSAKK